VAAETARRVGNLLSHLDADGLRSELILGHLRDFTGSAATRTTLMNDRTKAATREIAAEVGIAANVPVVREQVLNELQINALPKAPQQVVEAVKEKPDTINHVYMYGAPPPQVEAGVAESPLNPTPSKPPAKW
jgi:hypothetical protein